VGDRFYEQQNAYFKLKKGTKKLTEKKAPRRMKKDAIAELYKAIEPHLALEAKISGIMKLTIADIDDLTESFEDVIVSAYEDGETNGRSEGYEDGYEEGYDKGVEKDE
jgi:flagellar biosynthesis/type III secretory pathway protein FliH